MSADNQDNGPGASAAASVFDKPTDVAEPAPEPASPNPLESRVAGLESALGGIAGKLESLVGMLTPAPQPAAPAPLPPPADAPQPDAASATAAAAATSAIADMVPPPPVAAPDAHPLDRLSAVEETLKRWAPIAEELLAVGSQFVPGASIGGVLLHIAGNTLNVLKQG